MADKKNTNIAIAAAVAAVTALVTGCSSGSLEKSADDGTTRTISGKLALASYGTTLDNPVVYAMSAEDQKAYVAVVEPSGRFAVTVAAGRTYQLLVANRGVGGKLRVVSQVSWRSGSKIRWARITGGSAVSIGSVRPVGTSTLTAQDYGYGGGSGSGGGGESESSGESASGEPSGTIRSCSETSNPDGDSCKADLPYDAKLPLGATFFLEQSFWEKGPSPKKIVKVEVEGGWRAQELAANTAFTITQADCDHQGNKDTGRDRIIVTWESYDGSTETDHLDMRYCVDEAWPPAQKPLPASCTQSPAPSAPSTPSSCEEDDGGAVCTGQAVESECDAPGDAYEAHESEACGEAAKKTDSPCASSGAEASPASAAPCGCVPENGACSTNADCGVGLSCFASRCQSNVASVATVR